MSSQTFTTQLRVRYADTDQMGYVYYGKYSEYYEVARVEALRSQGLTYKALEASGFMLPVMSLSIQYKAPLFYDDLFLIESNIQQTSQTRLTFTHHVFSDQTLVNTAKVVLVCVDAQNRKAKAIPAELKRLFD